MHTQLRSPLTQPPGLRTRHARELLPKAMPSNLPSLVAGKTSLVFASTCTKHMIPLYNLYSQSIRNPDEIGAQPLAAMPSAGRGEAPFRHSSSTWIANPPAPQRLNRYSIYLTYRQSGKAEERYMETPTPQPARIPCGGESLNHPNGTRATVAGTNPTTST